MGVCFITSTGQELCDLVAGQPSFVGIQIDRLIGASPVPNERITDRITCRLEKV